LFATLTPEFHFTSAITKDDEGVDDVLGMLLDGATVTNEEWLVDTDGGSNSNSIMTPIEMVEEILREKIYRCLHREVPHNVAQQNRVFRYSTTITNDDGDEKLNTLHISQDLVVRTKSHQRLVLGSGGKTLERIKPHQTTTTTTPRETQKEQLQKQAALVGETALALAQITSDQQRRGNKLVLSPKQLMQLQRAAGKLMRGRGSPSRPIHISNTNNSTCCCRRLSREILSPKVKQMMDAWGRDDSSDGSKDKHESSDGSDWNNDYLSPAKRDN
jgi:hypothetical protein